MSFHVLICHLCILSRQSLSISFAHLPIGLFIFHCFESSLYTLDRSPLLDMWSVQTFSHCIACLFITLTGSFAEQKSWILMTSIDQFFLFTNCVYDVKSKNSSPNPKSQTFSLFFQKRFIVLHLHVCWWPDFN